MARLVSSGCVTNGETPAAEVTSRVPALVEVILLCYPCPLPFPVRKMGWNGPVNLERGEAQWNAGRLAVSLGCHWVTDRHAPLRLMSPCWWPWHSLSRASHQSCPLPPPAPTPWNRTSKPWSISVSVSLQFFILCCCWGFIYHNTWLFLTLKVWLKILLSLSPCLPKVNPGPYLFVIWNSTG